MAGKKLEYLLNIVPELDKKKYAELKKKIEEYEGGNLVTFTPDEARKLKGLLGRVMDDVGEKAEDIGKRIAEGLKTMSKDDVQKALGVDIGQLKETVDIVNKLSDMLTQLSGSDSWMKSSEGFVKSLTDAKQQIEGFQTALKPIGESFVEVGQAIVQMHENIGQMTTDIQKLQDSIKKVGNGGFTVVGNEASKAAVKVNRAITQMERVLSSVDALSDNKYASKFKFGENLEEQFYSIDKSISQVDKDIEETSNKLSNMSYSDKGFESERKALLGHYKKRAELYRQLELIDQKYTSDKSKTSLLTTNSINPQQEIEAAKASISTIINDARLQLKEITKSGNTVNEGINIPIKLPSQLDLIKVINQYVKDINDSKSIDSIKIAIDDSPNFIQDKTSNKDGQEDLDANTTELINKTEKRFEAISSKIEEKQNKILENTEIWRNKMKESLSFKAGDIEINFGKIAFDQLYNDLQAYFADEENSLDIHLNKEILQQEIKEVLGDGNISIGGGTGGAVNGVVNLDPKTLALALKAALTGDYSAFEQPKSKAPALESPKKPKSLYLDPSDKYNQLMADSFQKLAKLSMGKGAPAEKMRKLFDAKGIDLGKIAEGTAMDILDTLARLIESEGNTIIDQFDEVMKSGAKNATNLNFRKNLNELLISLNVGQELLDIEDRRVQSINVFKDYSKKAQLTYGINDIQRTDRKNYQIPTADEINELMTIANKYGFTPIVEALGTLGQARDKMTDVNDESQKKEFLDAVNTFKENVSGFYQDMIRYLSTFEMDVFVKGAKKPYNVKGRKNLRNIQDRTNGDDSNISDVRIYAGPSTGTLGTSTSRKERQMIRVPGYKSNLLVDPPDKTDILNKKVEIEEFPPTKIEKLKRELDKLEKSDMPDQQKKKRRQLLTSQINSLEVEFSPKAVIKDDFRTNAEEKIAERLTKNDELIKESEARMAVLAEAEAEIEKQIQAKREQRATLEENLAKTKEEITSHKGDVRGAKSAQRKLAKAEEELKIAKQERDAAQSNYDVSQSRDTSQWDIQNIQNKSRINKYKRWLKDPEKYRASIVEQMYDPTIRSLNSEKLNLQREINLYPNTIESIKDNIKELKDLQTYAAKQGKFDIVDQKEKEIKDLENKLREEEYSYRAHVERIQKIDSQLSIIRNRKYGKDSEGFESDVKEYLLADFNEKTGKPTGKLTQALADQEKLDASPLSAKSRKEIKKRAEKANVTYEKAKKKRDEIANSNEIKTARLLEDLEYEKTVRTDNLAQMDKEIAELEKGRNQVSEERKLKTINQALKNGPQKNEIDELQNRINQIDVQIEQAKQEAKELDEFVNEVYNKPESNIEYLEDEKKTRDKSNFSLRRSTLLKEITENKNKKSIDYGKESVKKEELTEEMSSAIDSLLYSRNFIEQMTASGKEVILKNVDNYRKDLYRRAIKGDKYELAAEIQDLVYSIQDSTDEYEKLLYGLKLDKALELYKKEFVFDKNASIEDIANEIGIGDNYKLRYTEDDIANSNIRIDRDFGLLKYINEEDLKNEVDRRLKNGNLAPFISEYYKRIMQDGLEQADQWLKQEIQANKDNIINQESLITSLSEKDLADYESLRPEVEKSDARLKEAYKNQVAEWFKSINDKIELKNNGNLDKQQEALIVKEISELFNLINQSIIRYKTQFKEDLLSAEQKGFYEQTRNDYDYDKYLRASIIQGENDRKATDDELEQLIQQRLPLLETKKAELLAQIQEKSQAGKKTPNLDKQLAAINEELATYYQRALEAKNVKIFDIFKDDLDIVEKLKSAMHELIVLRQNAETAKYKGASPEVLSSMYSEIEAKEDAMISNLYEKAMSDKQKSLLEEISNLSANGKSTAELERKLKAVNKELVDIELNKSRINDSKVGGILHDADVTTLEIYNKELKTLIELEQTLALVQAKGLSDKEVEVKKAVTDQRRKFKKEVDKAQNNRREREAENSPRAQALRYLNETEGQYQTALQQRYTVRSRLKRVEGQYEDVRNDDKYSTSWQYRKHIDKVKDRVVSEYINSDTYKKTKEAAYRKVDEELARYIEENILPSFEEGIRERAKVDFTKTETYKKMKLGENVTPTEFLEAENQYVEAQVQQYVQNILHNLTFNKDMPNLEWYKDENGNIVSESPLKDNAARMLSYGMQDFREQTMDEFKQSQEYINAKDAIKAEEDKIIQEAVKDLREIKENKIKAINEETNKAVELLQSYGKDDKPIKDEIKNISTDFRKMKSEFASVFDSKTLAAFNSDNREEQVKNLRIRLKGMAKGAERDALQAQHDFLNDTDEGFFKNVIGRLVEVAKNNGASESEVKQLYQTLENLGYKKIRKVDEWVPRIFDEIFAKSESELIEQARNNLIQQARNRESKLIAEAESEYSTSARPVVKGVRDTLNANRNRDVEDITDPALLEWAKKNRDLYNLVESHLQETMKQWLETNFQGKIGDRAQELLDVRKGLLEKYVRNIVKDYASGLVVENGVLNGINIRKEVEDSLVREIEILNSKKDPIEKNIADIENKRREAMKFGGISNNETAQADVTAEQAVLEARLITYQKERKELVEEINAAEKNGSTEEQGRLNRRLDETNQEIESLEMLIKHREDLIELRKEEQKDAEAARKWDPEKQKLWLNNRIALERAKLDTDDEETKKKTEENIARYTGILEKLEAKTSVEQDNKPEDKGVIGLLASVIKEAIGSSGGGIALDSSGLATEETLQKVLTVLGGNGIKTIKDPEMEDKLARIKELEAKQRAANKSSSDKVSPSKNKESKPKEEKTSKKKEKETNSTILEGRKYGKELSQKVKDGTIKLEDEINSLIADIKKPDISADAKLLSQLKLQKALNVYSRTEKIYGNKEEIKKRLGIDEEAYNLKMTEEAIRKVSVKVPVQPVIEPGAVDKAIDKNVSETPATAEVIPEMKASETPNKKSNSDNRVPEKGELDRSSSSEEIVRAALKRFMVAVGKENSMNKAPVVPSQEVVSQARAEKDAALKELTTMFGVNANEVDSFVNNVLPKNKQARGFVAVRQKAVDSAYERLMGQYSNRIQAVAPLTSQITVEKEKQTVEEQKQTTEVEKKLQLTKEGKALASKINSTAYSESKDLKITNQALLDQIKIVKNETDAEKKLLEQRKLGQMLVRRVIKDTGAEKLNEDVYQKFYEGLKDKKLVKGLQELALTSNRSVNDAVRDQLGMAEEATKKARAKKSEAKASQEAANATEKQANAEERVTKARNSRKKNNNSNNPTSSSSSNTPKSALTKAEKEELAKLKEETKDYKREYVTEDGLVAQEKTSLAILAAVRALKGGGVSGGSASRQTNRSTRTNVTTRTADNQYKELHGIFGDKFGFDDKDVVKPKALQIYLNAYEKLQEMQKTGASQKALEDQIALVKYLGREFRKSANEAQKLEEYVAQSEELSFVKNGKLVQLGGQAEISGISNLRSQMEAYAQSLGHTNMENVKYNATKKEMTFVTRINNEQVADMVVKYNAANSTLSLYNKQQRESLSGLKLIGAEFKKKIHQILQYTASITSIYRVWSMLSQGVVYVKEIDSALTELKKVTDETNETYNKFLKTASKTANLVGSTIKDIVSSTADWARLGYSLEQASKLAEVTSILLNVSEFQSIDDATSALVSTMQAFGYAAEDSMSVIDVMNEIGKLLPVDNYIG